MRPSLTLDGRLLVLISGPTASGKTTAARTLAEIARGNGHQAASIDMDEIVAIVAGDDWFHIHHRERVLATQVASAIVDKLFDSGMELVAIAGSTLANREWEELLYPMRSGPKPFYVLLRVSNEEAVRRAQNDPARTRSKDAAFITRVASQIDWGVIRSHHVDLITDGLDAPEVGQMLAREIFE